MLDQAPLQLDREGIKGREDGERGGGDYSGEGYYWRKCGILKVLLAKTLSLANPFMSHDYEGIATKLHIVQNSLAGEVKGNAVGTLK